MKNRLFVLLGVCLACLAGIPSVAKAVGNPRKPERTTADGRTSAKRMEAAPSAKADKIKIDPISWGDTGSVPLTGHPKLPIVLMEYKDVKFTVTDPQTRFDHLANQEGYSDNGATGSIRDYFKYNSYGKFVPEFVVIGPISLDKERAFYQGYMTEAIIIELFEKIAKQGIDISQFDNDKDGVLDNIIIYFAGHNEAESSEADAIWPHRSSIFNNNKYVDGIRMGNYICTSELKGGSSSTTMCGIGTVCHEFSHVLGLPDFYDMNGLTDGFSAGLFKLSIMSKGNYNNNGNTPPSMNAVERNMLGWLELEELDYSTKYYTLPPLEKGKAYAVRTQNQDELFILENRNGNNIWDSQIPYSDAGKGLLIYHLDRSENMVKENTAKFRWEYNSINSAAEHPCLRLLPATGPKNYGQGDPGKNMYFPGNENKTEVRFTEWSGIHTDKRLKGIRLEGDNVLFTYYDRIVTAEGMVLSAENAEIGILSEQKLEAQILPEDTENQKVVWSSSDESVARVDNKGMVIGVAEGTAVIKAESGDGKASATCKVTVKAGEMKQFMEFTPGQREARLTWKETDALKTWLVRWRKKGNDNYLQHESDTCFFIINHLEPDTEYEVEVSALVHDKVIPPMIAHTFSTEASDGDIAYIRLPQKEWNEGDRLWPVVNDIRTDIRKAVWTLDGEVFPATRDLILPAGKHELKVRITTGDGVTQTIVRLINVKPNKK